MANAPENTFTPSMIAEMRRRIERQLGRRLTVIEAREPRYDNPAEMFWWRKALARLIHVSHLDVSPGEAARFAAVVAKMRGRVLARSESGYGQ